MVDGHKWWMGIVVGRGIMRQVSSHIFHWGVQLMLDSNSELMLGGQSHSLNLFRPPMLRFLFLVPPPMRSVASCLLWFCRDVPEFLATWLVLSYLLMGWLSPCFHTPFCIFFNALHALLWPFRVYVTQYVASGASPYKHSSCTFYGTWHTHVIDMTCISPVMCGKFFTPPPPLFLAHRYLLISWSKMMLVLMLIKALSKNFCPCVCHVPL